MWKRIDTPLKKSQIGGGDFSAQSIKSSIKDSKFTVLVFLWALGVTVLLFYQIGFPSEGGGFSDNEGSTSSGGNAGNAIQENVNSQYKMKWHGGSPLDTFKGNCYCGEDKYCMCTPSLAIDAIIEIHHGDSDSDADVVVSNINSLMNKKEGISIGNAGVNAISTFKSAVSTINSVRSSKIVENMSRYLLSDNMVDVHVYNRNASEDVPMKNETHAAKKSLRVHITPEERANFLKQQTIDERVNSGGQNSVFRHPDKSGPARPGEKRHFAERPSVLNRGTHTGPHTTHPNSPPVEANTMNRMLTTAKTESTSSKSSKGSTAKDNMSGASKQAEHFNANKNLNISLVLVFRGAPPSGYAIPGGFVEVGETVEEATIREVKEETNLDLISLEQFHIYSDPKRDKRRHTVSAVFRCIAKDPKLLKTGDDAKSVNVVPLKDVLNLPLAFDHKEILRDYIKQYHSHTTHKVLY